MCGNQCRLYKRLNTTELLQDSATHFYIASLKSRKMEMIGKILQVGCPATIKATFLLRVLREKITIMEVLVNVALLQTKNWEIEFCWGPVSQKKLPSTLFFLEKTPHPLNRLKTGTLTIRDQSIEKRNPFVEARQYASFIFLKGMLKWTCAWDLPIGLKRTVLQV